LALRSGQELLLVHLVGFEPGWNDAIRQSAFEEAQARLAAVKSRAAPKPVLHTHVAFGNSTSLLELAEARHASLIVVGSPGHSLELLVNENGASEVLAAQSSVPVLVVREGDALRTWSAGGGLRVLVGVDETLSSDSAVRWVERLRELAPVDVVLGHVYYPDEAFDHYGLGRSFKMFSANPSAESLIERDLRQRVPQLRGGGDLLYRVRLGVGRLGDHLVALAEAENCSMIVVGKHSRKGFGRLTSVSAATLHVSRTAVAVIPPDGSSTAKRKPTLNRVLITTDFSERGNAAVPWGYSLVAPGGEVTLVYVASSDESSESLASLPEGAEQRKLAAQLRAIGLSNGVGHSQVVTRTEVLRGNDIAKSINRAAARLGVDAIVMSSHGRTGVKRAVLGSVAEEVLRGSDRPVFMVRGEE